MLEEESCGYTICIHRATAGLAHDDTDSGLWPYLDVLEHVGVVADLTQLHNSVHQCLGASFP